MDNVKNRIIAICIPTYKRPELLGKLLNSITKLDPFNEKVYVIVVDNDSTGSANYIVNNFQKKIGHLIYSIEPDKGIGKARNKLVEIAISLNCQLVAFVDDDETVRGNWLKDLLMAINNFDADVVFGPVVPIYEEGVEDWVKKGGFFNRKRRTSGAVVNKGGAGNVIFKLTCIEEINGPFNQDVKLGEDTLLFSLLDRLKARMVWCDSAIVDEFVPVERATVKWLINRAFISGKMYSVIQATMKRSLYTRLLEFTKGLVTIIAIAVFIIPSWFLGKHISVRLFQKASLGFGKMLGSFCAPLKV